ncbi:MAG: UvrD-helicase domain-containing protein [Planctomycetaceae bacterium]|nr:UvrD-helicase domain-containing protein [Planctomycetaceae bacterium]
MSDTTAKFPHLVIRASAGTGKTFRLAHRYLGLMFAGQQPDHVLAATFARKAAGEIVDRILVRLAEAIVEPKKLADLKRHVEQPQLTRATCIDLLRRLLGRLHRLRIGTLDSFFIQLASHFSFELGLPLGWTIIEDVDELQLRDQAIQAVLAGETVSDVATLVGMLFKGETKRSVSAQIRELVDSLYDVYRRTPDDVWQQIPRRRQMREEDFSAAFNQLATLPPFSDKRFAKAHEGDVERAQRQDWQGFLGTGLAAKIADGSLMFYKKPLDEAVVAAYQPLVDEAAAQLINALANQTEATRRLLDKYHVQIRRLKQERRQLRFDDVTYELTQGLAGGDVSSLAFRLDAHVHHLLLDEFQDTSLAQWNVVRPFAEAVTNENPSSSFFCVGDVKQAIYGWRGGVSEIFDFLGEQLPGVGVDLLTTSFRSSPTVIQTVNRVFHDIGANPALADYRGVAQAWQARFQPHTTAREELAGHARLVVGPVARDDQDTEAALLEFAASEIARLTREHPGRSVGVLVRKNKTVAKLMHLLRSRHQLAASEEGGNPLTDSAGVQLVLSALKLADHPQDTIARFHVAHSPLGERLGLTAYDNDTQAAQVARQIRGRLLTEGYGRTLAAWLPVLAPLCDSREWARLEQLLDMAYRYTDRASLRTDDFADQVNTERVEDPRAAAVRVMTVHQSKGLQFDIVVLPELEGSIRGLIPKMVVEQSRPVDPITAVCRYANADVQQLLPDRLRKLYEHWPDPIVHEGLCVLYVALTRAVHALHMIVAPADEQPGQLKVSTKLPKYSEILRAALAPAAAREPGTVLFESGSADWEQACAPASVPASDTVDTELIEVRLKPDSTTRRGLERQSPSQLQGGPTVDLAQRLTIDNDTARRRGSLLHAWFEAVTWLDEDEPSDATLDRLAREHAGLSLDLAQLRGEFRAILRRSAVRRALSRASYPADRQVEIWRERPFAVRDDHVLLQGAFDRVVLLKNGSRVESVEVWDYKTDHPSDDAALAETVKFYEPQLHAYRRAIELLLGLPPEKIACRLLFVALDRVVDVA